jgi:hypothetical protein
MKSFWIPDLNHPGIKMLEEWVKDNVMEAEKEQITESVLSVDIKNGRLIFRLLGSIFLDEDTGITDVLFKDFDASEELWEWFSDDIEPDDLSPEGAVIIESIAKDLSDLADALRKKAGIHHAVNELTEDAVASMQDEQ